MTPKEKAKELIDKYEKLMKSHSYKKQCALIAVEEIISNGGTKNIIQYKTNSFTNDVYY